MWNNGVGVVRGVAGEREHCWKLMQPTSVSRELLECIRCRIVV